jgi:L-fuconate dehydratase
MHPDPDYSAAYVILKTDGGLDGHGLTFTIGRGNEICAAGDRAFRHHVVWPQARRSHERSRRVLARARGRFAIAMARSRERVSSTFSMAAIVNAVWDLYAKAERKPVWKLLADMTPEEIVRTIDFRYITDALTPAEAIDLLERQRSTKADRERPLLKTGYPAYTTSAGWIGYTDDSHPPGVPRRHRRGLDALQGQGRRESRGR